MPGKRSAAALAMAGIRAGLREVPETISKTVKRRCQAELKGLGILLRRLIFLMALHVQLAPVKPRLGSYYFEQTEGETKSKYTFSLMPTQAGEAPDFLHRPIIVPTRAPMLAAPLIDRWQAMLEALQGAARNALPAHCSASKRRARRSPTSFPFQRPTPCTAPWPSSQAGSPSS
jgi:hypothetical protein